MVSNHRNQTIWIIDEYAGSPYHGMEFRHYYLAKQLIKLGYSVTIISASYSHLYYSLPKTRKTIEYQNIDGISYCWIKVINYGSSISKKRAIKWIQFSAKLLLLLIRKTKKPDFIILSPMATFVVLPSYFLARHKKAKFIFEVKDIWPLSIIELGGYSRHNPFILLMRMLEIFALRHADAIISNLPNYQQYLDDNGIQKKNHYIPNGIEIDEKQSRAQLPPEIKAKIPQDKFVVGYAGTIGLANGIQYLVDAARLLEKHKDIEFIIIGDGKDKEKVKQKSMGLMNLNFLPAMKKTYILPLLSCFSVCYIGLIGGDGLFKYGISPNKLFDYMLAGKPIIQNVRTQNSIVERSQCGICVATHDPQKIADAILELYHMSATQREKMGENGKNYVLKYHTYNALAHQLKEVLDGLESTAF